LTEVIRKIMGFVNGAKTMFVATYKLNVESSASHPNAFGDVTLRCFFLRNTYFDYSNPNAQGEVVFQHPMTCFTEAFQ
jgi:hypothetical protein